MDLENDCHRSPSIYRQFWKSECLTNSAKAEGSFVAEYPVDPKGFDILQQFVFDQQYFVFDPKGRSMSSSKSSQITSSSRLEAALVVVAF